jgi:hypothetical protein
MSVVVPVAVLLIAVGLQRLEAGLLTSDDPHLSDVAMRRQRGRTRRRTESGVGRIPVRQRATQCGSPYSQVRRRQATSHARHGHP